MLSIYLNIQIYYCFFYFRIKVIKQIFRFVHTTTPLLPYKIITKKKDRYILVNNDPIKTSRCTALIKAIALSLLTAATFGAVLGIKNIRFSFIANWRAVSKGNYLVERYELFSSKLQPHLSQTQSLSNQSNSQQLPIQTQTAAKPSSTLDLSDQEIEQAVSFDLSNHQKATLTIHVLEQKRQFILDWLKDPSRKNLYNNTNPNIAMLGLNELVGRGIPSMDIYLAVVRYMILQGDFLAYQPSSPRLLSLALNQYGQMQLSSGPINPMTKDMILKINETLNALKVPNIPSHFNSKEIKVWHEAMEYIRVELMLRHFRAMPNDKAVETLSREALVYEKVYDELVHQGIITEWNVTSVTHRAVLKIGKNDSTTQKLAFQTWRN